MRFGFPDGVVALIGVPHQPGEDDNIPVQQPATSNEAKNYNAGRGVTPEGFFGILEAAWQAGEAKQRRLASDCDCKCDEIGLAMRVGTNRSEAKETSSDIWEYAKKVRPPTDLWD